MSTMEQRMIGPHEAADLLQLNTRNRPLSPSTVATLTRDMRDGKWHDTGVPIIIYRHGTETLLEDGQHRLTAIVASGATIPLWISTVNERVYTYIDTGRTRSIRDMAAMLDVPESPTIVGLAISANAILSHYIPRGIQAYRQLLKHERVALFNAAPDKQRLVDIAKRQNTALKGSRTVGKIAGAAAIVRANGRDALAFLDAAYSDTGHFTSSPAYQLHRYLTNKHESARPKGDSTYGKDYEAIVRCWNAHAEARPFSKLYLQGNYPAITPVEQPASIAAD